MKKNEGVERSNIEKVGILGLIELSNDLAFGYSTDKLKSEVFWMFMAYVQSLETELDQKQKDCVFHFFRMYDFYEKLEKKITASESNKPQKVKKVA